MRRFTKQRNLGVFCFVMQYIFRLNNQTRVVCYGYIADTYAQPKKFISYVHNIWQSIFTDFSIWNQSIFMLNWHFHNEMHQTKRRFPIARNKITGIKTATAVFFEKLNGTHHSSRLAPKAYIIHHFESLKISR